MKDLKFQQEEIFQNIARIGHALASPHRLKMVSLLTQGPKTVEELAGLLGQSIASTSAHIKVLRGSGLVERTKVGRHVYSMLATEGVEGLWLTLRNFSADLLPEIREVVRDYFQNPESLSPLTEAEVLAEIHADRVVLLDLRPEEEFLAGHLPGARSIPFASINRHAPKVPANRKILAYCRGPYCLMAIGGTARLQALGMDITRLRFGVPEWRQRGYTLQTTPHETTRPLSPFARRHE
jgi:rhodanese-related sulfurtransferase/DNA-binding transcriptional ArsR family regulator